MWCELIESRYIVLLQYNHFYTNWLYHVKCDKAQWLHKCSQHLEIKM